ncbi:hypothetical protein [[Pseudopropionibacterium] massiliense]|uniref:hypothetical protein n=1 Tax=[Pseudopropionibacterium] massiliense TaxID=2220000 RepID=UPI0010302D3B|nr:hypothetical protein [[Pseudopropionibacterium] massiliense]
MAGKTRLVVEVLRAGWSDARVLFPKSEDDVEKLLKKWRRPVRGAIIFLDELERFLGKEEFTLGVLNTWTDDSCTVVATTTRMNYTRWRAELDSKFPGWEIVNRFRPLPLEAKLSDDELEAVGTTSYAKDLASIEQLGLGRVLGRAEDIRRRFTSALDSHKGRAGLVKAAADWSRVGLGSASKEALLTLAKAYDDDLWEDPDWESEWSWVIGKTTDAPLVLRTGKDSWEALDLIAEEADWPLTETTLTTMATCPHTALQAVILVFEMFSRNLSIGDRATESLLQEIAKLLKQPTSANPFATSLLKNIHDDHNRAENRYKQAIKTDPNNTDALHSYANFLTNIRHDHDRADELYRYAIKTDPENTDTLHSYANFLTNIRHDHDRAEELYKRGLNIKLKNAKKLRKIQHKNKQGEELYKQALAIDFNKAKTLRNYAHLMFMTEQDEKGVEFAERALELAEQGEEALCAECHFYLFMHSPRHRITSGRALKALLADGVTTGDWSFEGNLERLRQEEDPRYELARAVAEALRNGDTSALDDFEEWRDLDLPDREE